MPNAVTIYTDGACRKNPSGPGGYGVVILVIDGKGKVHETELSQGYKSTTNNRMELMSVIMGLREVINPSIIDIYSDSQYVVNAFNQFWLRSWKKNNWVKSNKEKVKNIDLWRMLLKEIERHPSVKFHWVKGHDSNVYNNRCDALAVAASKSDELIEDKEEIYVG